MLLRRIPSRLARALLVLALLACAGRASAAEFKPEVIRAAKRATAAVIQGENSIATAFCIEKSGLFLTSGFAPRGEPQRFQLLLNPGEADERLIDVEVVRKEENTDLALLKTKEAGDFPTLKLARDAEVVETQQLLLIGANNGELKTAKLRRDQVHLEAVVGRVTAILKEEGAIQSIQIDAQIAPFRAGWPALNEAGEVVGLLAVFLPKKTLVPASTAASFLGVPQISFVPPTVRYEQRYQPQSFSLRLASFQPKPPGYSATLTLGDQRGKRTIEFTRDDQGTFTEKTPLLEKPADAGRVPVEIAFAGGGLVRGYVDDGAIKAGKAGAKLSELARIERREEKWHFLGRNEQQETGEKLGLKKVWVGAAAIDVPWNDARSITIFGPADEPDAVPYEIVVHADGKPVASQRGQIAIVGRPPSFDDSLSGAMVALDGSVPWPAAFDAPPIATGKTGLKGLGRRYVRTPRGDFLKKDFAWELVFTITKDDPILFIGLGEGRSAQHEGEPAKSVNFRIHSQDVSNGEVVLTRSGPTGGQHVGKLPPGTHRAILRKQGDRVTFAIDIDNNGPTPDDIQQIVANLREFAPFLDEANTYLFFGGGGTFQKMRLVEKR